jgi:hypothetical protein
MGSFGAARGATALAAAGVREPAQLVSLHARLHRWERPAARAALGAQALLLAGALAVALA